MCSVPVYSSGAFPNRSDHSSPVHSLNRIGDPVAHFPALRSFLGRWNEIELQAEHVFDVRGEYRPCDADIGGNGKTAFETRKTRHFHAERDPGQLSFGESAIHRLLHLRA